MPVIPDVPLSDRKLRNIPDTIVANPLNDRSGDIIARGLGDVGNAFGKAAGVFLAGQLRAENLRIEQEAEELTALWNNHTRKGIFGDIVVNQDGTESVIRGIKQKPWTDYDKDRDQSAIKDFVRNQRDFEESDVYRNASPGAIALFKKRSMPYRQTYIETVNGIHDRNTVERLKYWKGVKDASDDQLVETASGDSNEVFLAVSSKSAMMKAVRELSPFIEDSRALDDPNGCTIDQIKMAKPEYQKMLNERYNQHLYKYATDRITYLTQRASKGKGMADGSLTAEDSIRIAYEWLDEIGGDDGQKESLVTKDQRSKLYTVIRDAENSMKFVRGKQAQKYFSDSIDLVKKNFPKPPESDYKATEVWNNRMASEIDKISQNPVMYYDQNSRATANALINSYRTKAGWSAFKVMQRENMITGNRAIQLGIGVDRDGNLIKLDSNRIKQMADSMLQRGEIDHNGWESWYDHANNMIDDESIDIAQRGLSQVVSKGMLKKIGVRSSQEGILSLTPSSLPYTKDKVDSWSYNTLDEDGKRIEKEEVLTVGNILDVLNACIREGRNTGKSSDQIVDTFTKLVTRQAANLKHLSIQQTVNNLNRETTAFSPSFYFGSNRSVMIRQPFAGQNAPKTKEKKEGENNGK